MKIVGFEHLHLHSSFSLLDGYGQVEEYCQRAKKINQQYLCITDHGMMAAIPEQIRCCEEHKLSSIFGIELYVNPLQPELKTGETSSDYTKEMSAEEYKRFKKSYHLLAIAYNEKGYSNLVKLSSLAWTKGFYRHPRVNHQQLMAYKEGIIFTSCCYNSEIGQAFDRGGEDEAFTMLEKYMAMFGENFYLEIMLLDFVKQKPYDAFIIKAHQRYGLPIILTQDCHYANPEDSYMQRLMLMIQTRKTLAEIQQKLDDDATADLFELQDQNLWLKSEEELNAKWLSDYQDTIDLDLFNIAKQTTVEVCRKAANVKIDRTIKLPQIPDERDVFKDKIMRGFKERQLPRTREYLDRVLEEYSLITRKGFASYFLLQQMMTDSARAICPKLLGWGDGNDAVGAARGCLGGNSPIVMSDGTTKYIKDVQVGDNVITHDGSVQEVTKTHCYSIENESLVNLKVNYGDNKGITLTKDHLVLCEKVIRPDSYETWAESTKKSRKIIKEPTGNLQWLAANDVEVGDWLFVPRPEIEVNPMDRIIDLSKYCDGGRFWFDSDYCYHETINPITKRRKLVSKINRFFDLDDHWMILMGLFAGDGWLRSDRIDKRSGLNTVDHGVGFCFNSETDIFGKVLLRKKLKELEIYFKETKHKEKKLIQIHAYNFYLKKMFKEFFHHYKYTSQTKHVPAFVFKDTDERKKCFLKGYRLSDGTVRATRAGFSTSSKMLADQVRFLCWQLNIPASNAHYDRIDKRSGTRSVGSVIDVPNVEEISSRQSHVKNVYRNIEGGLLVRVRKKSKIKGVKRVYDISVENNSNYLTNSFLVHNSGGGSLVNYCLGITDVDPIKHDLLFSRFLSPARGGKQMKLRFPEIVLPA